MNQKILDIIVYAKNNKKTQQELAKLFDVSQATVNKALAMIDIDIEKYKVDNAILFAAGWGSRMSPITDTTPKPLVKVKGQPMIENIIERLIEKDIKEIYVVVGKFEEQFQYLVDKYNVTLISNPDWSTRNNISSLYFSQNIEGNSLYLECDQILSENAIRNYYSESCFHGDFVTQETNEWCFVLNGKKVIDIKKGGNKKFQWNGIVFITKEHKKMVIDFVNEKYHDPEFEDLLFEFSIIKLTKQNKLSFSFNELKQNDCLEFDTIEELAAYDDSYKKYYDDYLKELEKAEEKIKN